LGTSTAADAKKYFSSMDRHMKPFKAVDEQDRSSIEMAFSKKKADERKEWLRQFVVNALKTLCLLFLLIRSSFNFFFFLGFHTGY